jgi:BolA protein
MMEVDTLINLMKDSLNNNFKVSKLDIINESHLHVNHPQRPKDKYHLSLTIRSKDFSGKSLVSIHKQIYKILDPFMQSKVHALRIDAKEDTCQTTSKTF